MKIAVLCDVVLCGLVKTVGTCMCRLPEGCCWLALVLLFSLSLFVGSPTNITHICFFFFRFTLKLIFYHLHYSYNKTKYCSIASRETISINIYMLLLQKKTGLVLAFFLACVTLLKWRTVWWGSDWRRVCAFVRAKWYYVLHYEF